MASTRSGARRTTSASLRPGAFDGACRVLGPRSLSAVVITCEHASPHLPAGLGPRAAAERRILESHWGWDIGAWSVATRLAGHLGASAVGGAVSRLVVDLNRSAGDPSLVRCEAEGVRLSWNAPVPAETIERRMLAWHVPYHQTIDALILRRLVRGVRPLLFSTHTFTNVYEGRRRDFDIGVLFDRSRTEAAILARGLRRAGYRVLFNRPYSGLAGMMYAIHRHGVHHGLPCLELEINQDLFIRPGAARRIAADVARALRPVIATTAAEAPATAERPSRRRPARARS
jgi:predicted N-formylglutamate amidohydrolase